MGKISKVIKNSKTMDINNMAYKTAMLTQIVPKFIVTNLNILLFNFICGSTIIGKNFSRNVLCSSM